MVQHSRKILQRMTAVAALLLATGFAHADIITGAGAGPGKSVNAGGKKLKQAGVNTAAGDLNGDGKDAPKQPVTPIAPIAKPVEPVKPPMPPSGPASVKAPPAKPQPLLLPAVQKIRESAARIQ